MGKRVTGKRQQRVELPMDNYIRKEKRGERKCKLVLKADENGSEDESHNGREGGRVNKPPLQKRVSFCFPIDSSYVYTILAKLKPYFMQ